jgi:hypothetical protein
MRKGFNLLRVSTGATMKYIYLTLLLIILLPCAIFAQPSITGTNGDWVHDGSVTITGSSFGSKSPAAPLIWDECEGNTTNLQSEITDKAWTQALPSSAGSPHDLVYRDYPWEGVSAPHANSTQCMAGGHHHTSPATNAYANGYNVGATVSSSGSDKWFVTYYSHMGEDFPTEAEMTCDGANFKDVSCGRHSTEMYSTPPEQYQGYDGNFCPHEAGHTLKMRLGGATVCGVANTGAYFRNPRLQWVRIIDGGTMGSSKNIKYWKKSNLASDNTLGYGFNVDENNCTWRTYFNSISTGGFYRKEFDPAQSCLNRGDTTILDDDAVRLFDDIYIDNTWSRVMLGDSSTLLSCTILEPQIPTSWTDNTDPTPDEIVVTVNMGALTGSNAYLYVWDSDNNVNATGYLVSLGTVTTTSSSTTTTISIGSSPFYLREGGTNADPDCSGSSPCCAGALDISDHNSYEFEPGDTIYLCDDGGTFDAALDPQVSGEFGNVITYAAYTGDSPIIRQPNGTNSNAWITIDQDYLTFEGITFDANGTNQTSGYGRVVQLSDAAAVTRVTFDDCTFKGARNTANAYALGCGNVGHTVNTVQNCTFEDNYIRNIYVYGELNDFWTIDDNTFTLLNEASGVEFRNGADWLYIRDNTISGGADQIMIGDNATGDTSSLVFITGNTLSDFGNSVSTSHAIQVFVDGASDYYTISNNTVSDPADDYDAMELAWQGNPLAITVSNNVITNSTPATGDSGIVVDTYDTGTAVITNNVIKDMPRYGLYRLGGNNDTITGNLIKDCGTEDIPGLTIESMTWEGEDNDASNHLVAHNILDECERGILLNVRDGLTLNGVMIYNNTINRTYSTDAAMGSHITLYDADSGGGTMDGIKIKNNILYDNGATYFIRVGSNSQTNFESDYNIFYDPAIPDDTSWKWGGDVDDTTLTAWQSATSDEANSLTSDPLFVDGSSGYLRLQGTSSPAYNSGVALGLSLDYYGIPTPQFSTVDRGGVEYHQHKMKGASISGGGMGGS